MATFYSLGVLALSLLLMLQPMCMGGSVSKDALMSAATDDDLAEASWGLTMRSLLGRSKGNKCGGKNQKCCKGQGRNKCNGALDCRGNKCKPRPTCTPDKCERMNPSGPCEEAICNKHSKCATKNILEGEACSRKHNKPGKCMKGKCKPTCDPLLNCPDLVC